VDGSGNVVVAGNLYTAKYAAADGALIWEQGSPFTILGVAVDTNGDVVVSRQAEGFGFHNFITKHAAADGALLWEQLYPQRAAKALAVDSGGNVIVAGTTGIDSYTAKFAAADGALLWERQYAGPANAGDEIRAVAVDQSGNVAVTGVSYDTNCINADHYTAKYAAVDGTPLWERRYNGTADGNDEANAVAVDLDGNVVMTGNSYNGTNSDFYTAKYAAADGALLWEQHYNGPANSEDHARAVALDGSGDVMVTGTSYNGTNSDYYTAKYAAGNGALLWEQRYNGPANGDEMMGNAFRDSGFFAINSHSLALGPNGMVVITGSSDGNFGPGTTYDFATVVYREILPAVAIDRVPSGVRLRFTGESGRSYRIERAPAVNGPWTTLTTPTAPLSGLIEYLDVNPPPGQAFYRTTQP
jgi:hypothetical protein